VAEVALFELERFSGRRIILRKAHKADSAWSQPCGKDLKKKEASLRSAITVPGLRWLRGHNVTDKAVLMAD
jgi:hypothetical protein